MKVVRFRQCLSERVRCPDLTEWKNLSSLDVLKSKLAGNGNCRRNASMRTNGFQVPRLSTAKDSMNVSIVSVYCQCRPSEKLITDHMCAPESCVYICTYVCVMICGMFVCVMMCGMYVCVVMY